VRKGHQSARRSLTRDINAEMEGALRAGADDIVVLDGRGVLSIILEELNPKANL